MSNRFTEKAEKALNNAVKTAEDFGHTYIGSEHILLSLCLTADSVASVILKKHNVSTEKIKNAIKDYSGIGLKSTLSPKDMTPCSKKIVESSYRISIRYNAQKIGTEHILLSILEEKDSVAAKLFSYMGTDLLALTDEVQTLLRCADKNHSKPKESKDSTTSALRQHGKNMTEMARDGKIDPVIGRERETERLIRILCRKNKNNPCLIGEAGVGKTAIVEGLAHRIAEGSVPPLLYGKEIICVDLTSMVSGTKYRGDFEERIKSIINEAARNKSIILFIDELHTIVGAGAAEGAIDAANILKPQLSRGEIQLIGATTFSEYHKYIEKDAALERRFQPITVEEATVEETLGILRGVKAKYELHHNVNISDGAIEACVKYSTRYIQDRYLPDKALDVLDEACAKASARETVENFNELRDKMKQLSKQKEMAIQSGDFVLAKSLHDLEENYGELTEDNEYKTPEYTQEVTETDIKEIINEMTGIPVVGIGRKTDREQLVTALRKKVVGQESAIQTLADAVMRSECGISDPNRPKGVFLFSGSSGVGKTELAKAIAEELFFDKHAFFKYDMSEFSESNSVTKLIGSPPGYVGHEEGGALTEKVRRHPYSIILFDEIEKAHTEVLDLFLQIADNGTLTDSCGRSVDFKNAYIIFTSNVGSSALKELQPGFVTAHSADERKAKNTENLMKHFRVEFLNRIDEIIFFRQISKNALAQIAEAKLDELKKRLASMGIGISFSKDVAEHLASVSMDEKFGVRKLLRSITSQIESPISFILTTKNALTEIKVFVKDEKIVVEENDNCVVMK